MVDSQKSETTSAEVLLKEIHAELKDLSKNALNMSLQNHQDEPFYVLFREITSLQLKISDYLDSIAEPKQWSRWRFKTKLEKPIIFNESYPYWISGSNLAGDLIVVAYLPTTESLEAYWSDASEITRQFKDSVEFTDRFPAN